MPYDAHTAENPGVTLCGIAGVVDPDIDPDVLDQMLGLMAHRGPDDSGIAQCGAVRFGHRRLAVLDPTSAGHQPMRGADGRYLLTYNGELYNYRTLRRELLREGHRFTSACDTEVVLAALAAWGKQALQRFVGMFALGFWDREASTLLLARDRLGEKPLYYARSGSRLAFASELRPVALCPWVDTDLNHDAVRLFLAYRSVPAPLSIRTGIAKLPPGHLAIHQGGGLHIEPYWSALDILSEPRLDVNIADAAHELDSLLARAVNEQLAADVPLGAFLSGGVDSSLVASYVAQASTSPLNTFTVGFGDSPLDESAVAAQVAGLLGSRHHARQLEESTVLNMVPELPTIYDEPFADPGALASHLVAKLAAPTAKVCLTGDGGDESFGGYRRYTRLAQVERLSTGPQRTVTRHLGRVLPGRTVRRLVEAVGSPLPEVYSRAHRLAPDAILNALTGAPAPPRFPQEAWTIPGARARRSAMASDLITYLPDQLLTKVDRAAMAASLETRAPLLDHRVVEFALRLPESVLHEKAVLKHLLRQRLPDLDVDRPKQGFMVPIDAWLCGGLRPMMQDVMTREALTERGVVDVSLVRRLQARHERGENFGDLLWALFTLCLWPI